MPKYTGGKFPKGWSFDLDDAIILPGFTEKDATYQNVDLSTKLTDKIVLRYPFIAAAMSCVTGEEMALECAKNGVMAVVPRSFSMEYQTDIIRKVKENEVKKGEIEFNENPVMVKDIRKKIKDAVDLYNEYGHSNIPICDDFRVLKGTFRYRDDLPSDYLDMPLTDAIEKAKNDNFLREIIKPFDKKTSKRGTDYFLVTDSKEYIEKEMKEKRLKAIPVIRDDGIIERLVFVHEYPGYYVGGAIHTYPGWEKRTEMLVEAGADMIFIDTSDARSKFVLEVVEKFKKKYPDIPLCAGNVVSGEGYKELVMAGADVVKVGMGSGNACITSERRGVGRGLLTTLADVFEAKEEMNEAYKKPIIADGGIGVRVIKTIPIGDITARIYELNPSSITKALMFSDAVMCGTLANMFEEAAGRTIMFEGKRYKERWGEGSLKGISLARYGIDESIRRGLIEEGVADLVNVVGRLKPNLEKIFLNVALTIGNNCGAKNLEEFRSKAQFELLSPNAWRKTGVD